MNAVRVPDRGGLPEIDMGGLPEIDMGTLRRSHRIIAPIARHYFRAETRGLERIPAQQTILVANHDGGALPIDTICFGVSWYEHFSFERPLYVLTHDIFRRFSKGMS